MINALRVPPLGVRISATARRSAHGGILVIAALIVSGCAVEDPLGWGLDDSSASARSAINGTWDFHYGESIGATPAFAVVFERGEALQFEFSSESSIQVVPLNGEPAFDEDGVSSITMTGELSREEDEYVLKITFDFRSSVQSGNSSSGEFRLRLGEDGLLRGTFASNDDGVNNVSTVIAIRR